MTGHLDDAALVERADTPEVARHLAGCASCRARLRLVGGLDALEPPTSLQERLDAARQAASRGLATSLGGGRLSVEDEADELEVGRTIERYRVEARLGSGGMGTVYRVRHLQLGSAHALKVVRRGSRAERDRLLREGRAQSSLRHPNLVPVTDVVDVDGAPGLILDLVEGPSLFELLLERGRLPADQADDLARGILRGVAAAHRAGLVHRDLKPANVLLAETDGAWVPKVTDFGLARVIDTQATPSLVTAHGPLGTPSYMAPEQVRDAAAADRRSDVFSLGALLYELVSGERAFPGVSAIDVYERIRSDVRPRLDGPVPDAPARWVAAIDRALSVDPGSRFGDAQELLAAWTGESSLPVEASRFAPTPASRPRWPVAVAVLAMAVVLVVGLSVGRESEVAQEAVVVAADVPKPVERRLTARAADAQIFAVALSPSGDEVAFTDAHGVWRQRLDGGGATQVLGEGPFHDVDWLPGGERLVVYGTHDAWDGVWTVGTDGSDRKLVFHGRPDMVRLAPDGRTLALADATGLWLVDLADGARRRVRPLAGADATASLAWSPDGAALAAVHRTTDGSAWLEVTRADGRETRRLVEDPSLISLGLATLAWVAPDRLVYTLGDEYRMKVRWMALDGASMATDGSAARETDRAEGYQTTHLDATPDGRRMVVSRVVASQRLQLLTLATPGEARGVGDDEWSQVPLGWSGPAAMWLRTSRAGGESLDQPLDGTEARVEPALADALGPVEIVGADRYFLRFVREHRGLEIARWRDGLVETMVSLEGAPRSAVPSPKRYRLRCGERCLLSRLDPDGVRFFWLDADRGALLPAEVGDVGQVRDLTWDLSPDGERLVFPAGGSGLVVRDLATGVEQVWPHGVAQPIEVAWSAATDAVYVSGLTFDAEPYRLVEVRPGGGRRVLWSAMSAAAGHLTPSPDGRSLAFAAASFDDDLWVRDGLGTP